MKLNLENLSSNPIYLPVGGKAELPLSKKYLFFTVKLACCGCIFGLYQPHVPSIQGVYFLKRASGTGAL
jgi:hypothetical protein